MANVLGVSGNYHDAASALIIDGRLVAALQEERLSRIKNDSGLPWLSMRECLKIGGISPQDLDGVWFYEDPYHKLEHRVIHSLSRWPRGLRAFPTRMKSQLGDKLWVLDQLSRRLGVARDKIHFVPHHLSHAASALFAARAHSSFGANPDEPAAVLVMDGVGEEATTSIYRGAGDRLECLAQQRFPHSLGLLYAAITSFLGFAVNEGEYKVMGLAAWGEPLLRDQFAKLCHIDENGLIELQAEHFGDFTSDEHLITRALVKLLGPPRPFGRAWDLTDPQDQRYAHIAATLQEVCERAVLNLAKFAGQITSHRSTPTRSLALAGGVALNSVAIGELASRGWFEHLFVQPAAGDAGGALGAAYLGAIHSGDQLIANFSPSLGVSADVGRAQMIAAQLGLKTIRSDSLEREVAERLAGGQLVAWVEGRSEWGPRALGQRSLLADARSLASKERLNAQVKRREPFRPFAPITLAEESARWFDPLPAGLTPYMTGVAPIKHPSKLLGISHPNQLARYQHAPEGTRIHALLKQMGQRCQTPVLINTSLNGQGEPICATETDALAFLIAHPVDALVIEDLLIIKPDP